MFEAKLTFYMEKKINEYRRIRGHKLRIHEVKHYLFIYPFILLLCRCKSILIVGGQRLFFKDIILTWV